MPWNLIKSSPVCPLLLQELSFLPSCLPAPLQVGQPSEPEDITAAGLLVVGRLVVVEQLELEPPDAGEVVTASNQVLYLGFREKERFITFSESSLWSWRSAGDWRWTWEIATTCRETTRARRRRSMAGQAPLNLLILLSNFSWCHWDLYKNLYSTYKTAMPSQKLIVLSVIGNNKPYDIMD